MATTLATLVNGTRRYLRDWPAPTSALTISLSTTATSITVADTSLLPANYTIEIDQEVLLVTASVSATVTNILRGWAGSTAASHANTATILVRPGYYAVEIIDALNSAKDEMYPYVYKPITDTSLTVVANQYEYTVPNMTGTYGGDTIPIQYVSKVEIKESGDYAYRPRLDWDIKRASSPKIVFRSVPQVGATIRVFGFGPFPDLALTGDSVDAQFPKSAEKALILGAASRLLGSGEAGRSRMDVGARDDREAANKPGNAISLGNQLERRFEKALLRAATGPMPPHVKSVF